MTIVKIPEVLLAYHRKRRPGDTPRRVIGHVISNGEYKVSFSGSSPDALYPISDYTLHHEDGSPYFFPPLRPFGGPSEPAVADPELLNVVNTASDILNRRYDQTLVELMRFMDIKFMPKAETFELIHALVRTSKGILNRVTYETSGLHSMKVTCPRHNKSVVVTHMGSPVYAFRIGQVNVEVPTNREFLIKLLTIASEISNQLCTEDDTLKHTHQENLQNIMTRLQAKRDETFSLNADIIELIEASLNHGNPEAMADKILTYNMLTKKLTLNSLDPMSTVGEVHFELTIQEDNRALKIGYSKYPMPTYGEFVNRFRDIIERIADELKLGQQLNQQSQDTQPTPELEGTTMHSIDMYGKGIYATSKNEGGKPVNVAAYTYQNGKLEIRLNGQNEFVSPDDYNVVDRDGVQYVFPAPFNEQVEAQEVYASLINHLSCIQDSQGNTMSGIVLKLAHNATGRFELNTEAIVFIVNGLRAKYPDQLQGLKPCYHERLNMIEFLEKDDQRAFWGHLSAVGSQNGTDLVLNLKTVHIKDNKDFLHKFDEVLTTLGKTMNIENTPEYLDPPEVFETDPAEIDFAANNQPTETAMENLSPEVEQKLQALLPKLKATSRDHYYKLAALSKEPKEEISSTCDHIGFLQAILASDYGSQTYGHSFDYMHEHIALRDGSGNIIHDAYLKITHHDDGTHFVFNAHKFVIKTNEDFIGRLQDITNTLAKYLFQDTIEYQVEPEPDDEVLVPATPFADFHEHARAKIYKTTDAISNYLTGLGLAIEISQPKQCEFVLSEETPMLLYEQSFNMVTSGNRSYCTLSIKQTDAHPSIVVKNRKDSVFSAVMADLLDKMPEIN